MASYPVEMRRCQHIKTGGTQCGSPALREGKFCYHHQECRPERVEITGADGKSCEILVPVFEDASSIQMMVRRVVVLLLQDKIDDKKAGRVLYALQIASSNLKRMEEEKAWPEQVVIDREKVAETPLGMTQWSATGAGRDVEEDPWRVEVEWEPELARPEETMAEVLKRRNPQASDEEIERTIRDWSFRPAMTDERRLLMLRSTTGITPAEVRKCEALLSMVRAEEAAKKAGEAGLEVGAEGQGRSSESGAFVG